MSLETYADRFCTVEPPPLLYNDVYYYAPTIAAASPHSIQIVYHDGVALSTASNEKADRIYGAIPDEA